MENYIIAAVSAIVTGIFVALITYLGKLHFNQLSHEVEKAIRKDLTIEIEKFAQQIKAAEIGVSVMLKEEKNLMKRELEVVKGEVKLERSHDLAVALSAFRQEVRQDRQAQLDEQDAKMDLKLAEMYSKVEALIKSQSKSL